MQQDPVTETIKVKYSNNTFTFRNANGDVIRDGDLSAYPGANSFTFVPDDGETWRFTWAQLVSTAELGGTSTMGLNDDFRIQIASLQNPNSRIVIQDNNREAAEQEYKYSFRIHYPSGESIDCDPKIYNKIN